MFNSRSLSSASLIAILLVAGAAIAYYSLGLVGLVKPKDSPDPAHLLEPGLPPGFTDPTSLISRDTNPEKPDPDSMAQPEPASDAIDESPKRADRRAARFEAYSKVPAEERARAVSKRWGLSDEQHKEIEEIMKRYGDQMAALDNANTSAEARAEAQRQIQSQQMLEIAPIVRESPAIKRSMKRFVEAGTARGGRIVGPSSQ